MTISSTFVFVITSYLLFTHKCSNAGFDVLISSAGDNVRTEWHNTGNRTVDWPEKWTVLPNSTQFLRTHIVNDDDTDCAGVDSTFSEILRWYFHFSCGMCENLDVKFYLSSRQKPRVPIKLGEQFSLEHTDFKIERRTVVIVHGFLSTGNEQWIKDLEAAFQLWGDVNVMVIDWGAGGNSWNYYNAVAYTKIVGRQIARMLNQIANATLASGNTDMSKWGDIHMVGHSLGAHICGFVCYDLREVTHSWVIKRVTGLDPAQPCFKTDDPDIILDREDTEFVDVIHTNGRPVQDLAFGIPVPIGHSDFYPNGGMLQPGCSEGSSFFDFLPITPAKVREAICSHGRSYIYLTESLVNAATGNCTFWAHEWDRSEDTSNLLKQSCNEQTCSAMGITAVDYAQRGSFYVPTSSMAPFCEGNIVKRDIWLPKNGHPFK